VIQRYLRTTWILFVFALLSTVPATAQSTSGQFSGKVVDAAGRIVKDAVVQARSEATGTVRTALTSEDGRFTLQGLEPGRWTVVARQPDGQVSPSYSFILSLQQTVKLTLTIGEGMTETVQVEAGLLLLNPKRTGGELRIRSEIAEALPIAGDSILDLAMLDASVKQTTANQYSGERGSAFVINGQSGRANTFLVDGMDNNDQTSGTNLNASFSQPPT